MATFLYQLTVLWLVIMVITSAARTDIRNIMYLTGQVSPTLFPACILRKVLTVLTKVVGSQHPVIPNASLTEPITHVALAFMWSDMFNGPRAAWPLFMSVEEARSRFQPGTKIMVAIGGWGDTAGFDTATRTEESRAEFARNVAAMVRDTGADGVDIDWEYPGGNGEDYKRIPNSEKAWEIAAYPLLLSSVREALGPSKLISAAVPGLPRDMLAFTSSTIPQIMDSLDFLNVMAYDLMNRRDNITEHHSGIRASLDAVEAYIQNGAAPSDVNLGFGFYTKYFHTDRKACEEAESPIGCPTGLMEDPETGDDLGRTGGFSWHDDVPKDVKGSFERAMKDGKYDDVGGGYWYWDEQSAIWWTFDTPDAVSKKFPTIVERGKLGGVFAWGLGEDAPDWAHLRAVNDGVKRMGRSKDEL